MVTCSWLICTEDGFCDAELVLSPELGELYYWPETFVDEAAFVSCIPLQNFNGRLKRITVVQASRVCAGPGLWDAPDFTDCVNCGSLPDPENGFVSYNATTLGAVAIYTCDMFGYELVGPATRVCQGNLTVSEWSGEDPVCRCK